MKRKTKGLSKDRFVLYPNVNLPKPVNLNGKRIILKEPKLSPRVKFIPKSKFEVEEYIEIKKALKRLRRLRGI